MRVAHFLGSMRPGHDGVTRVAYRLREEFRRFPESEHFFVSPILPENHEPDFASVPSVPLPLSTNYRLAVCRAGTIHRSLGDFSPDLIHLHSPCTLGHAAARFGQAHEIPVVATYHTHFPTYLKYYRIEFLESLTWRRMRALYGMCDSLIVPSLATLKELKQHGLKNLVHIPHGVDTSKFSPRHRSQEWRRALGAEDRTIVSFVGRLVWEKNLATLAKAFSLLTERSQIKLVIVGEGPAREKLTEMLPEAHFTGFLGEKDLPVAYASSDIFVFPSTTETFGNVTIEAMASGLPPICAAAGGACDIVSHGKNGLLTAPSDARDLARAIDHLVSDREYRKHLAEKAFASSAEFTWENSAARYINLYSEVLDSNGLAVGLSSSEPFARGF